MHGWWYWSKRWIASLQKLPFCYQLLLIWILVFSINTSLVCSMLIFIFDIIHIIHCSCSLKATIEFDVLHSIHAKRAKKYFKYELQQHMLKTLKPTISLIYPPQCCGWSEPWMILLESSNLKKNCWIKLCYICKSQLLSLSNHQNIEHVVLKGDLSVLWDNSNSCKHQKVHNIARRRRE